MKSIIIYNSVHHRNTEKIAKVMAEILKADLTDPSETDTDKIKKYDLIGFGSGIYVGKHHKKLLEFIDDLPVFKNKKVFIFSTSGMHEGGILNRFNKPLEKRLLKKGFTIIGKFSCLGFDTVGPLKLIGAL